MNASWSYLPLIFGLPPLVLKKLQCPEYHFSFRIDVHQSHWRCLLFLTLADFLLVAMVSASTWLVNHGSQGLDGVANHSSFIEGAVLFTMLTKLYLSVYNAFQFAIWAMVLYEIMRIGQKEVNEIDLSALKEGNTTQLAQKLATFPYQKIWDSVAPHILIAQGSALLEVIHPILGLTKGSAGPAIMQFLGRGQVVLVLAKVAPQLQASPYTSITLFVWSFIEVVRYPTYLLSLWNAAPYFLIWLRYSLWIPLYPVGMATEAVILWNARLIVGVTKLWSFDYDAYFYFLTAWIALLAYGYPSQLHHMWQQRRRVLSPAPRAVQHRGPGKQKQL